MYSKAIASLIFGLGALCFSVTRSYGAEPGFSREGTRFIVQHDHGAVIAADQKLVAMMKAAEVAPVGLVQRQHRYLLLLIRQPTRPLPMHRCGAGTEDRLLLLEADAGVAHVKDMLQLQSCEAGEHLDVDDPESTSDIINGLCLQGDELSFRVVRIFFDDQVVPHRYHIADGFKEVR
jgi:hypothetical protein